MKVGAAVVMLAVFLLKISHEPTQRLALFSHDVRQQKGVQQTISLRQVAAYADAARFFTADEDVAIQHEIADVFETDAAFMQLTTVFCGDAVEHAGCIESPDDIALPSSSLQDPLQDDGVTLVRIDEAAVFSHRAEAVSVTIGRQAGMARFADNC